MTLRFNKRLSITPVEEGGGSGVKIITATNSTGAAVSSGDKVFVNYKEFTGQNHGAAILKEFIASDFHYTDRYITFDKQFDFSKPWEFRCKVFRNDSEYGDQKNNFIYSAQLGSQDSLFAAGFCLFAGDNFSFYVNTTEGRQQFAGGQINPNTTYWIRCGWTGTEYYLNYSTDNETFTSAITSQSTSPVTMSVTSFLVGTSWWISGFDWKGTIDLKEMSMTIDNTVVWQAVADISPKLVEYTDINYYSDTGIAKENIAVGESGDVVISSYINNQNKTITTNGTYTADTGYTGLGTVNVNVPVKKYGADVNNFLGDIDANGVLQKPTEQADLVFTGVEDLGADALVYGFYPNMVLKSVSFPDLISVSGNYALEGAFRVGDSHGGQAYTGLSSISFPKLETISGGHAFDSCFTMNHELTSVSFPKLTTVSGSNGLYRTFSGCESITSATFPELTTVSGSQALSYLMSSCQSLTSLEFPKLSVLTGTQTFQYAFNSCTALQSISFPALTSQSFGSRVNQFNKMLQGVSGCTVHFPSNLQSVIGSWSDVANGFGGTNTTVLFDLPATE